MRKVELCSLWVSGLGRKGPAAASRRRLGPGDKNQEGSWPASRGLTAASGNTCPDPREPGCQPDSDKPSEQHRPTARVSLPTAVGDVSEKEEITLLGSAGSMTAGVTTTCQGGSGAAGRGAGGGSEQRERGGGEEGGAVAATEVNKAEREEEVPASLAN